MMPAPRCLAFCRAQMNDGDMVVLACLQQNRARISKACQQVLTSHGVITLRHSGMRLLAQASDAQLRIGNDDG